METKEIIDRLEDILNSKEEADEVNKVGDQKVEKKQLRIFYI